MAARRSSTAARRSTPLAGALALAPRPGSDARDWPSLGQLRRPAAAHNVAVRARRRIFLLDRTGRELKRFDPCACAFVARALLRRRRRAGAAPRGADRAGAPRLDAGRATRTASRSAAATSTSADSGHARVLRIMLDGFARAPSSAAARTAPSTAWRSPGSRSRSPSTAPARCSLRPGQRLRASALRAAAAGSSRSPGSARCAPRGRLQRSGLRGDQTTPSPARRGDWHGGQHESRLAAARREPLRLLPGAAARGRPRPRRALYLGATVRRRPQWRRQARSFDADGNPVGRGDASRRRSIAVSRHVSLRRARQRHPPLPVASRACSAATLPAGGRRSSVADDDVGDRARRRRAVDCRLPEQAWRTPRRARAAGPRARCAWSAARRAAISGCGSRLRRRPRDAGARPRRRRVSAHQPAPLSAGGVRRRAEPPTSPTASLAIFDTTLRSIERQLDRQARLFDPLSAPADRPQGAAIDFLSWLASWIGITLDRDWPEQRRRRYLKAAARLYCLRGTRYGLWRAAAAVPRLRPAALCCAEPSAARRAACRRRRNCGPAARAAAAAAAAHPRALPAAPLAVRRRRQARRRRGAVGQAHRQPQRSSARNGARVGETQLDTVPDPLRDPFLVYAHRFTVFVPARVRAATAPRRGARAAARAARRRRTRPGDLALRRAALSRRRAGDDRLDSVVARTPHGVTLGDAACGTARSSTRVRGAAPRLGRRRCARRQRQPGSHVTRTAGRLAMGCMATAITAHAATVCAVCEFEPFVRNNYFTGKMMGAARLRRGDALSRREAAAPPRAPARLGRGVRPQGHAAPVRRTAASAT